MSAFGVQLNVSFQRSAFSGQLSAISRSGMGLGRGANGRPWHGCGGGLLIAESSFQTAARATVYRKGWHNFNRLSLGSPE
jgi:hypothetical protein